MKKAKNVFFCTEPNHDDNTMSVICTEQSCPKNGLICASCMIESHMKHSAQCMKYKDFLSNYNEFIEKSIQKKGTKDENLNYLETIFKDIMAELAETKKHTLSLIEELEKNILQQYKESVGVFENKECSEIVNNLRDLEEGNVKDQQDLRNKVTSLMKDCEKDTTTGKIYSSKYMSYLDRYSIVLYSFSGQRDNLKKFFSIVSEKFNDYFRNMNDILNTKKYELPLNMIESKLLDDQILESISKWTNHRLKYDHIRLIYKGSKDGFKQSVISQKCNNQGPTFSLIRSNYNRIFGAYAEKPLNNICDFTKDEKAFIYSISDKQKFEILENVNAFWGFNGDNGGKILYWFGACGNIGIREDCDIADINEAIFLSYKSPNTSKPNSYLAGAEKYRVLELEIYKIINN